MPETSRRAERLAEARHREAGLKKRLKEAEAALDAQAYARYPTLGEAEIKTLVVERQVARRARRRYPRRDGPREPAAHQRVKELAERYETPLPQWSAEWPSLKPKWIATWKRWGSRGSEARLQAD